MFSLWSSFVPLYHVLIFLLMFQRNILPLSSGWLNWSIWKLKWYGERLGLMNTRSNQSTWPWEKTTLILAIVSCWTILASQPDNAGAWTSSLGKWQSCIDPNNADWEYWLFLGRWWTRLIHSLKERRRQPFIKNKHSRDTDVPLLYFMHKSEVQDCPLLVPRRSQ